MNKILLHVEGLAVLGLCIYLYSYHHFSWVMFFILLFAPDIMMLGYLFNRKVGAIIYNIVHTYSLAIGLVIFGLLLSIQAFIAIGLILAVHIGMDRMFGLGLKYPTDFKHTHLNRV